MSAPINIDASVAQLVIDQPHLARVFDQLGIDYCCGGDQSLRQASADKGLDAATVVKTIKAMAALDYSDSQSTTDWTRASLSELCDHIEQTHHRYLNDELPRLKMMVDTVAEVHGDHHQSLYEVRQVFDAMRSGLQTHTEKENEVVFPLIRALERGGTGTANGSVAGPIQELADEHDVAGESLSRLRLLTEDYVAPAGACGTYQAMLAGLEQLERDTHQHIHKENNILFPRALAKAKELSQA